MHPTRLETIPALLTRYVPRELVLTVEDGLTVGAARAFAKSKDMDPGHRRSVMGQLRHFHMNEAFYQGLTGSGIACSPLRANELVTGDSGIFTLARFNIREGLWVNGRRSETRRQMALANRAIEPLVHPDLFERYEEPKAAVAFFVAVFGHGSEDESDAPMSVALAVPNSDMTGWLFREPLAAFLARYDAQPVQADLAKPRLKQGANARPKDGTVG